MEFHLDETGRSSGFRWTHPVTGDQVAERFDLPERFVRFPSGDLSLRGKLVTPLSPAPHPVVVVVHGSGKESAVDTYYNPYLFAAHGIATLVYDKRGTGESEGKYLQNFHVLADDVLAAVDWLRQQPEIDTQRIHLAGYSQGGWIAPLAASRTSGIRSLLIGYGPMVSVVGEDRWGYVYALEQNGFGGEAIAAADDINAVMSDIMDHGADRWKELEQLLDEAKDEPWYAAVRGSDSALGFLTDTRMPWWMIRAWAWWMLRPTEVPFVDRLYDPVPTLSTLDVPSLWIFGGEDHSMPTGWTVDELEKLRDAGRPIEIEIFPGADHGILVFQETPEGERSFLGYEPEYLPLQVAWLRSHSGLEAME
jgi:dienelactone hydrolase